MERPARFQGDRAEDDIAGNSVLEAQRALIVRGEDEEQPEAPQPSTIRINLNLGEVELSGPYGFALDDGKINSPGPQIVVRVGDVIIITATNIGQLPHSFAIAAEAKEGADPLFNSQIGSGSSPVVAGETGTVTFTVGQAGTYSYICQVPGHATIFEMFGTFLVEE